MHQFFFFSNQILYGEKVPGQNWKNADIKCPKLNNDMYKDVTLKIN